jgi:hypothetical protein
LARRPRREWYDTKCTVLRWDRLLGKPRARRSVETRHVIEKTGETWEVDAFDWVDGYLSQATAPTREEALKAHARFVQEHQVPGHKPQEMEIESEEEQRLMRLGRKTKGN